MRWNRAIRRGTAITLVLFAAGSTTVASADEKAEKALTGGAVGAAGGALLGAIAGNAAVGAAIGGGVGVLVGHMKGKEAEEKKKAEANK